MRICGEAADQDDSEKLRSTFFVVYECRMHFWSNCLPTVHSCAHIEWKYNCPNWFAQIANPFRQGEFVTRRRWTSKKISGRDQELRTPTLVRPRPIQGDGHVDFPGESEGSLPPPHDSFPGAGEAMNDFWSMSGSFKNRHHVEPRVKLCSPREESFPIPLRYIDVTKASSTTWDVILESRIDDYWNVEGDRDLSDTWTGFTR